MQGTFFKPGETFKVPFVASNPRLWMDHCHNLDHAQKGMTLHVLMKIFIPLSRLEVKREIILNSIGT
ncbi:multicopper oxidase domain-containing protein [Bacillus sp. IITD106]|nr:multicopper oxidase domain-containing protein [Bacillus sp. IITD106]